MKEFDFYEVTGVIAPGMVLIVGAVLLFFPDQHQSFINIANVSLGSLGVGLILAYVVGQILQAVGNTVETIWWWFWGGMPTDWIRSAKQDLVASNQRDLIQTRLRVMLNAPTFELSTVDARDWCAITRQMYAAIAATDRFSRVYIFNGNYGLCRGIAAAFLVLFAVSAFCDWQAWRIETTLAVLIILALYRMHRFGVRYGRELCVQYLQSGQAKTSNEKFTRGDT